MQSAKDIRSLTAQYSGRPEGPLAAVLKCAAGLLILFAVAAGPWLVLTADGTGILADGPRPATAYPSSIAESRRIFEERRQRVQGVQETAKAALAK